MLKEKQPERDNTWKRNHPSRPLCLMFLFSDRLFFLNVVCAQIAKSVEYFVHEYNSSSNFPTMKFGPTKFWVTQSLHMGIRLYFCRIIPHNFFYLCNVHNNTSMFFVCSSRYFRNLLYILCFKNII